MNINFFPSVNLIITNACRMNCSFCCAKVKEIEDIKAQKKSLIKIIKILSKNGTKRICFSGGEPLMASYLIDLLKLSHKLNITNTIMSSDGILINKLNIPTEYIDTFWISVHGIKNEHDNITGIKGSFDEIVNAISNSKQKYAFGIWSVITLKNKNNIDALIKWCIENKIKRLYLSNINAVGKGKNFINKNGRITDKDFTKWLTTIQKKYKNDIAISGQKFNKIAQCVLVYSNGDVYLTPYNNDTNNKLIGNILNESPQEVFSRIKNNKKLWDNYIYRYKHSNILKK